MERKEKDFFKIFMAKDTLFQRHFDVRGFIGNRNQKKK